MIPLKKNNLYNMRKISIFQNIKNPNAIGVDTIDGVLQCIKNGHTKEKVELARGYGRGTHEYGLIKAQILTFTPNAYFYPTRKKENLNELSGFIYLDFDNYYEKGRITEAPFIYACWKSVSDKGYGALAIVEGLSISNFNNSWQYLYHYFKNKGLEVDTLTKDITRQNIISYDPHIYINKNAIAFDALTIKDYCKSKKILSEANTTINQQLFDTNITLSEYNFSQSNFSIKNVKYKTTLTDYNQNEYLVVENGLPYRGCFLPKSISDGRRHRWLTAYIISLMFNNPLISIDILNQIVIKANNEHCSPPMNLNKLMKLTNWLYDKCNQPDFDFKPHLKKIWFNPSSSLDLKEKRKIIGKEVGSLRRKKTLSVLQKAYDELRLYNEIVTQKMVREWTGLSLRTIKSRWREIIK